MEDMRSRSCGDGRIFQMEVYGGGGTRRGGGGGGGGMNHDMMRCYSASYASSMHPPPLEPKLSKGKTISSSSSSTSSHGWGFNDPELQRKKRVAGYKAYAMEGKMKGSLRKSFRWIKDRYTQVVYGWR